MSDTEVRVFPTLEDASDALAEEVARQLGNAVADRETATLALSGGSTPRRLHEILAQEHPEVDWRRVHVFWGDERFVPRDSEDSNYRMARETLLGAIPIPDANVHPWPVEMSEPESAALAMQVEMERVFGSSALEAPAPRFDVMLLGMGDDGHTASLFPHSPALRARDRWTVRSEAPDEPRDRLTFTLPVLNAARHIHFLVAGESKHAALRCAMDDPSPDCPASLVRPEEGTLSWWLDEEVAP
ncbi:MAG: 6-phosphogluconolactonase [Armatimonadota bacterium]